MPKPITTETLHRKYMTLLQASLEFWMVHPPGSAVLLRNRRTGHIVEGLSKGTSRCWCRAYETAPMPRIRLPDGKTIALDVTAKDPTWELVEPLPVMGADVGDVEIYLLTCFFARYKRRRNSFGKGVMRTMERRRQRGGLVPRISAREKYRFRPMSISPTKHDDERSEEKCAPARSAGFRGGEADEEVSGN